MRILLTGASGFIGGHLLRVLSADRENEIFAVARSIDPIGPANVRMISLDLSQPGWTGALTENVDTVIHLAQSRRYRDFPEGARDVVALNVDATVELADWGRRHAVRRFLLASSGNVYPTDIGRPLREEDPPRPASLYGASKLSAEFLLEQYGSLFEVVLMRIFGVYGPGQQDMLIPATIRRILNDEEITLANGAGIYVSPLFLADCTAMMNALLRSDVEEAVQRVNLAGPEVVSLAQIVARLEVVLQRRARIVKVERPPMFLAGSCDTVKRLTGHDTFVPLEEGLRRTWEAAING